MTFVEMYRAAAFLFKKLIDESYSTFIVADQKNASRRFSLGWNISLSENSAT
jgi:hypothetical protein